MVEDLLLFNLSFGMLFPPPPYETDEYCPQKQPGPQAFARLYRSPLPAGE